MSTLNEWTRSYSSQFLVRPDHLVRMRSIVEKAVRDEQEFAMTWVVEQANHTVRTLATLDHVIDDDNPIKNPIVGVKLHAELENDADVELEYRARERESISLSVRHVDVHVGSQLFAELEEQVERTLDSGRPRLLNIASLLGVSTFVGLMLMGLAVWTLFSEVDSIQDAYRAPERVSKLEALAEREETLENQMDFLYEVHASELEILTARSNGASVAWSLLWVLVPLACIALIIIYLVRVCYPAYVFLWGDWIEHFSKLQDRRRFLWRVVIVAFLVGVVANLFASQISFDR